MKRRKNKVPPAVIVKVAFGNYSKGFIIPEMAAAYRQEMIRRGFVEPYTPPKPKKRGGAQATGGARAVEP